MSDTDGRHGMDVWVRRAGALVVAGVAAYVSYQHQRTFALHGGADATSAGLWPLSVDGLLLLATAGLLVSKTETGRRARLAAWLAFGLGIAVSLAANVASAPTLDWRSVLVAGWPPVALLLAVELLAHQPNQRDRHVETEAVSNESRIETPTVLRSPGNAEALMWAYFQREQSEGRTPTGAELDRVAGTNNFGRAVLLEWSTNAAPTAPGP